MEGYNRYFFIRSRMNDMVFDVKGKEKKAGARIQMYRKKDGNEDNQLFYEDYHTGSIRSKLNDFCLDIDTSENRLILNPFKWGDHNQQWKISGKHIRNKTNPNQVLDIVGKDDSQGARICKYDENGQVNQHWAIDYVKDNPGSYYFWDRRPFLIKSQMNGMVMDIKGEDEDPGARVQMFRRKEGNEDNQMFYEDYGTGTIRSMLNDFCLDIKGDSLVLNPYKRGDDDQQWMISNNVIRNRKDRNKVLDIAKRDKSEGARICKWDHNGGENQLWTIDYVESGGKHRRLGLSGDRRSFHIKSKMNDLVLDVKGEDKSAGAKVQTYRKKDKNEDNQLFYEDYGTGTIRSMLNDFCLDIAGDCLVLNPYKDGDDNQQWMISGKYIRNRTNPKMVLDIAGSEKGEGARVCKWEFHGKENQQWVIDYVD